MTSLKRKDAETTATTTKRRTDPEPSSPMPENWDPEALTTDSIYQFYSQELYPAIIASLPVLLHRLSTDSTTWLKVAARKTFHFLMPAWSDHAHEKWSVAPNLAELWEQAVQRSTQRSSMAEFMLRHFDTNGDGHISSSELVNMTEMFSLLQPPVPQSFWTWLSREWPLMDWKLGVFLWRSFGGLLLVIAILSIVPGRLHSMSGKVLRWPILGMTYGLIGVELAVYILIRLVIQLAEILVAKPKHRTLRRKMAKAKSYMEWYKYAAALDASQRRDEWQRTVHDGTSYRYNWAFVRQLVKDMRRARSKGDSLLALAILQQCTRKNVGGVMSEDLFSFTNTGEPKQIVKQFVDEVAKTIRWITDEALRVPEYTMVDEAKAKESYEKSLESKVRKEKDKMWKSLISWATLSFVKDSEVAADRVANINMVASDGDRDGEMSAMSGNASVGQPGSLASESIPCAIPGFHKEQLIGFLKRARAAYGRTALCLSGGAMMGLYHFGHVLGLMETDCLPNIISGTSAGSVVGAVLCTRTIEELKRDLRPEVLGTKLLCFSRPWGERLKSVWREGHMFDTEEWLSMIKWFTCGDMTFEEAYKKTGKTLCITLSSTTKKAPPVLLNYISAPNVTIASAVVASAAVPGFIPPMRLYYKDSDGVVRIQGGKTDETYFDGSIEQDIPVSGLAEMLNCQFFVACQANPHVVPFFFNSKGGVGSPSRWSSGEQEASWRGGFLLAALEMYLKNDMKAKFVFLNDLEAAVGFTSTMMTQSFEGSTTIVPSVQFSDYFKLFTNPDAKELHRYFQAGAVAAFQHAAMIRLHYSVADALDDCLEKLEGGSCQVEGHKRASMGDSKSTANMLAELDRARYRGTPVPAVMSAALNDRLSDVYGVDKMASGSTSESDDSY